MLKQNSFTLLRVFVQRFPSFFVYAFTKLLASPFPLFSISLPRLKYFLRSSSLDPTLKNFFLKFLKVSQQLLLSFRELLFFDIPPSFKTPTLFFICSIAMFLYFISLFVCLIFFSVLA